MGTTSNKTKQRYAMHNRTLTDEDVKAISEEVIKQFRDGLYKDLGRGVWGLFQKAVIALVGIMWALGHIKWTGGGN
jgi:hypothetical protein